MNMNQVLSLKCIALHITHMCIRVGGCCFSPMCLCVCACFSFTMYVCMQKPSLDKCAFKHFVSPCAKCACALAIHVTLRKLAMNAQLTTLYAESFKAQQERQLTKKKVEQMQLSNLFIYIDGKMVRVDASKDQPGKNPYAYYEFSVVAASLLPYHRAPLIHVCAHSSSCTFHRVFVVFFLFLYRWCKTFSFHTTFVFHSKFIQYFPCLWINDVFFCFSSLAYSQLLQWNINETID